MKKKKILTIDRHFLSDQRLPSIRKSVEADKHHILEENIDKIDVMILWIHSIPHKNAVHTLHSAFRYCRPVYTRDFLLLFKL